MLGIEMLPATKPIPTMTAFISFTIPSVFYPLPYSQVMIVQLLIFILSSPHKRPLASADNQLSEVGAESRCPEVPDQETYSRFVPALIVHDPLVFSIPYTSFFSEYDHDITLTPEPFGTHHINTTVPRKPGCMWNIQQGCLLTCSS